MDYGTAIEQGIPREFREEIQEKIVSYQKVPFNVRLGGNQRGSLSSHGAVRPYALCAYWLGKNNKSSFTSEDWSYCFKKYGGEHVVLNEYISSLFSHQREFSKNPRSPDFSKKYKQEFKHSGDLLHGYHFKFKPKPPVSHGFQQMGLVDSIIRAMSRDSVSMIWEFCIESRSEGNISAVIAMYKKNTRDGVEIYLFDPFFGVLNISKMGWGVKTHIRIWNHLSSEYGYESWNCSGMLVDRISFEPLDDDDDDVV